MASYTNQCPLLHSFSWILPQRKVRTKTWALGCFKFIKKCHGLFCSSESHREKASVSFVGVATLVVEYLRRAVLGIIHFLNYAPCQAILARDCKK